MRITFHGAARGVTGSKHLIELANKRVLLDCGFFQGRRAETRKLNQDFGFDPASIDAVVLSHAHLDHCGLLPLLVKKGFTGKIFSTPATKDVAKRMLGDSAGIQESDYRYLKKCGDPRCEELASPLYTRDDIPAVMRRFVTHNYVRSGATWLEILPGVKLKFHDAGHILGSAVTVLESGSGLNKRRLVYTGDLGRRNSSILYDPQHIREQVDVMLAESTYGSKGHASVPEALNKLVELVEFICERRSKLIIPAFSLGRTQEIVYLMHYLTDTKRIPRFPIYVDSPLAGRVTEVFRKYRDDYDLESQLDFKRPGDVPLAFRNLRYVASRDESMSLNSAKGPLAIISASGMAEGGRVLHHLKHSLRSPDNVVLFTGYQARHTLGRRLIEHQSPVRIYRRSVRVGARIEVIYALSAHADGDELAEYIASTKGLAQVFLIHGEIERAKALRNLLGSRAPDLAVDIPKRGQTVSV